ncbi:MAG: hypothetical protein ABH879_10635 [archaeon]
MKIKKGQVTVFIVVGLVLLLSVGLFFYIRETEIFSIGKSVPGEVLPVKRYAESCMQSIAEDGIFLLEMQGGYIDPEREFPDLLRPDTHVDMGFTVPLWYYGGESRMPTREQTEEQLENLINLRFEGCMDFSGFENLDIEEQADLRSRVTINDNDITVQAYYPLEITSKMGTERNILEDYSITIPTKFGRMYRLAATIMDAENSAGYLEVLTDEMIANSDWLPYLGMELTCMPRRWDIAEMKDYIKTLIEYNIRFLRFHDTNDGPVNNPYYDNVYRIDVSDEDFEDISVGAEYNPDWDFDLTVAPSKQGVVKPIESPGALLLATCVKFYNHKYSFTYKVLFKLVNADNPEEVFFFATPVILVQNEPNRHNEVSPWTISIDAEGSSEYCSNISVVTEYAVVPVSGQIISYPDEIRERDTFPMRVAVRDSYFGIDRFLQGVNISYQCVQFLCENIGSTEYPLIDGMWTGEDPILSAKFPGCLGGMIIAEKEGYKRAVHQQTVDEATAGSYVSLEMVGLKKLDFSVNILREVNGILGPKAFENENALIFITGEDFERTLLYPAEVDYYTDLSLMVGDYSYDLDIKLIRNDTIVGGASMVWKPDANAVLAGTRVVFNAIEPETPDPEIMWSRAVNMSRNYPTVIQ